MKKTKPALLLLAIMMFGATPVKAQKQFFASYSIDTGNEWGDLLFQLPWLIANAAETGEFGLPLPVIPLRFNSFKQNGQKWDYDGKHVFGFKGVDLFRDFEVEARIGWQPVRTPVAIFGRFGFSHENFDTRANEGDKWLKHRINYLRPGLGIRLSPFENLVAKSGFCPVLEIGSTYDYHLGYKNGIDDSKDAVNDGISITIAAGLKLKNGCAIMLTFDKQNYDLLNNDYVRYGNKPFEGVTNNHYRIYLGGSFAF